jgi:2-oxo-4-hydroxy-4-carboxy--5-ureidoimidazoline (OHCU) decarboxylase
VHDLPRQLRLEELEVLFEGRTRFVERLSERERPLAAAREVARGLPEEEKLEALNAHPAIGARKLSAASAREQGGDADPAVLEELHRLNEAYERKFGFRFVVFVNRRSKAEIVPVLRERLERTREQELETALDELIAIAEDRWRRR